MYLQRKQPLKKLLTVFIAMLILAGLYISSLYNYLLFHSLAEIFSVVIACAIFMITWNSRNFLTNGYLLVVGIAFLFIGVLDLAHTLSYKGMAVFPGYGANLPTQLWIASRYLQALSFLMAPLFLGRQVITGRVFLGYLFVLVFLVLSIFHGGIFPLCYIEGTGLTPFKIISEYVISIILMVAILILLRNRQFFDQDVLKWLILSLILTIFSEVALMFYVDVYGFSNLIGHYLKIISFFYIYRAIIETGVSKPYAVIFREMKLSKEWYRSLFSHMLDGFAHIRVIFDESEKPVDFVFLEINNAFEELTGLKKDHLIGKLLSTVMSELVSSDKVWMGMYEKAEEIGGPFRFEHYSDTLEKWFSIMAFIPEEGHLIAIFADITHRKTTEKVLRSARDELEERVKERTAELREYAAKLEWKNRELQEFAYVASHDLQEPLRKIQMFGNLLEKETGEKLSAKAGDYLSRMTRAAVRMRKLIQDLLIYSRISTKSKPFSRTDLNESVHRALENLEARVRQTGAEIKVGELPFIEADPVQMTQLFQNLVGNALKFTGNRKKPEIEIAGTLFKGGEESQVHYCEIQVKDNGMGFDEKYVDKIFQPFERLKNPDLDAEGTGIGLAICRRIVERHGGRITATSVPEKGSTFIIVLPIIQGGKV